MVAHVLALTVDLRLPSCRSLKEKRSVLTSMLDGARRRYQVAASETGSQQAWQRAEVGFACVSPSVAHATEVIEQVERFVWSFPEAEVLGAERAWVEP